MSKNNQFDTVQLAGASAAEEQETLCVALEMGYFEDAPTLLTDGGAESSLDRVFDALSHPSRRRILMFISEHNTDDEDEVSVEEIPIDADNPDQIRVARYHAHLPNLSEWGYIEWNKDSHRIRRGPNFEEIAPVLRLMQDHQDQLPYRWP